MQYPILLTVAETRRITGLGKTTIYQRVKSGELKTCKFGRGTRITLASVIQLVLNALRNGNGLGNLSEIFGDTEDVGSCFVAEALVVRLYNTHTSQTLQLIDGRTDVVANADRLVSLSSNNNLHGGEI
jgi:excisionase family DNA binding protein